MAKKKAGASGLRVAYVTQWFAPEFVIVVMSIANALRSKGHRVQVLTGNPNFPDGNIQDGYRAWGCSREVVDGFPVKRTPLYPSHDSSAFRRIVNYGSWALSSTLLGFREIRTADVALVYSSPATAALPAMVWRRLARTPYVLIVQDVWPDSVLASGFIGSRRLAFLIRATLSFFVNWSYRSAEHIIVISPGMMDLLESRGIARDKMSVVFNWADESVSPEYRPSSEIRHQLGVPAEDFLIAYAGNHGSVQGLNTVIEAASYLADDTVSFLLVGDGLEKPGLIEQAANQGCNNVYFLDPVTPQRVQEIQSAADVQLISLIDDPLFEVTLPSKVQSILSSGRAVLAVASGNIANVVNASGAGWVTPPGNVLELVQTIHAAATSSKEVRNTMGLSGRRYYLEHMSEQIGADRLHVVLRDAAQTARNESEKD